MLISMGLLLKSTETKAAKVISSRVNEIVLKLCQSREVYNLFS